MAGSTVGCRAFEGLRAPARFVYLMDFALAMLAALGLDALLRPLEPGQRAIYRRLLRMAPWVVVGTALLAAPFGYFAILDAQSKDAVVFWRVSMAVDSVALFLLFLTASLAILWMRGYRWVRRNTLGLLAVGLIAVDLASTGAYVDLGHQDPAMGSITRRPSSSSKPTLTITALTPGPTSGSSGSPTSACCTGSKTSGEWSIP